MATLARTQAVVVTERRRPGPGPVPHRGDGGAQRSGPAHGVHRISPLAHPCRATIPRVWCGVSSSSSGSAWSAFVVSSLIDYRLLKTLVPAGYIISVLALVGVLFTRPVNGARSWFQLGFVQIQPSEIGKVALILTLAAVLAPAHTRGLSWRRLLLAVLLAAIPMALIFRQPDFGTMFVWGFITLIMLYAGGTSIRQFLLLTASAIAGGLGAVPGEGAGRLPDDPAHQLPRPDRRSSTGRLEPSPVGAGHRERRAVRQGSVPRHPDRAELCPCPADRLHLHRGGGAARIRRGRVGAGALPGDRLAAAGDRRPGT